VDEAAYRTHVREQLDGLLERRRDRDVPTVMGAGTDDLEAGRRFLAGTGLGAPTWPVE
jgi:hypothetical protein